MFDGIRNSSASPQLFAVQHCHDVLAVGIAQAVPMLDLLAAMLCHLEVPLSLLCTMRRQLMVGSVARESTVRCPQNEEDDASQLSNQRVHQLHCQLGSRFVLGKVRGKEYLRTADAQTEQPVLLGLLLAVLRGVLSLIEEVTNDHDGVVGNALNILDGLRMHEHGIGHVVLLLIHGLLIARRQQLLHHIHRLAADEGKLVVGEERP
mmetsp:Transcript_17975/g.51023  ORF Transcript_17975/g.51023 Transcript_17975/m.51023 type:complete len:206 (+) Transcript_17975:306-923(+)